VWLTCFGLDGGSVAEKRAFPALLEASVKRALDTGVERSNAKE